MDLFDSHDSFRGALVSGLRRQLLGPIEADSEDDKRELLSISPLQLYATGVLFPQRLPQELLEDSKDQESSEVIGSGDGDLSNVELDEGKSARGNFSDEGLSSIEREPLNLANEYSPSACGISRARGVPLLFAICAPCQPFTKLSRKALTRKRKEGRKRDTNLLFEAAKLVSRFRPELVLSENVAGINDPKYGGVWNAFRHRLDRLGYLTGTKVVCTSKFGIPQFRKRSILIAVRRDVVRSERVADLRKTELLVPDSDPDATLTSVREAIGHLPLLKAGQTHRKVPNYRARTLSDTNLKRLSAAEPGESNEYMEKTQFGDLSLPCHQKVNRKLKERCFSDVYTRMHPDRPSPTITTKCHSISNGRYGHYDIRQLRGISLREAAVLQSFPDNYVFYPVNQIEPIARMIGNAVPPKLAEFYAGYLVNSIAF